MTTPQFSTTPVAWDDALLLDLKPMDDDHQEIVALLAERGTVIYLRAAIGSIKEVKDNYGWQITPEQLAWYRWKIDPGRELDEGDPEDTNLTQEQPWV